MTARAVLDTARERGAAGRERVAGWARWLESPLSTYYLIVIVTAVLVSLGLVMVLSASSITSYINNGSPYTLFKNQAIYAVGGVIVCFVVSRMPVAFLKRTAPLVFLGALFLQSLVLVPGIAKTVNGNTNWIGFGSVRLQPSETGKIALVLVVALVLANRRHQLYSFRRAVVPVLLFVGLFLLFVMIGGDLGTTMVIGAMTLGMLWVAGVRRLYFGIFAAAAAVLLPLAVLTSGNRTARISAWLGGCNSVDVAGCYQKVQGSFALADGGPWGLGLGASREKWQWLPEAHNDFIFSIIGEELGLPGTLAVLAAYLLLAHACVRLIARSDDFFVRVATGGIMTWICVQAIINIGSVLGLLPIVGVPLPLVSAGGTALIMTLVGIGLLLAFARSDPQARAALDANPRRAGRVLAILPRRKEKS